MHAHPTTHPTMTDGSFRSLIITDAKSQTSVPTSPVTLPTLVQISSQCQSQPQSPWYVGPQWDWLQAYQCKLSQPRTICLGLTPQAIQIAENVEHHAQVPLRLRMQKVK